MSLAQVQPLPQRLKLTQTQPVLFKLMIKSKSKTVYVHV
jgi:hypothetical protein